MEKETKMPYDMAKVDKLAALLLLMFGCSEMLLSEIEKELAKGRCRMKREPKMLIGRLLEHGKGMHAIYDRLYELSVENGRCTDGDTNIVDSFLGDKNTFLRFYLMTENALHGDTDNKRQVQLESVLKVLAKNPVLDQDYIDRLTNFR